jgi:hypothetical protein
MSTFTKRTIIVWDKATYQTMVGTMETPATNSASVEFGEKAQEFIDNNKMDEAGGSIKFEGDTAISIKHFVDEAAAQEWLDFCKDLATRHDLKIISSRIRPIF